MGGFISLLAFWMGGAGAYSVGKAFTLETRDPTLTLKTRDPTLTLETRDPTLTLEDR